MTKRLFVGIELPDTIREALAGIDPQLKNVRWTQPEQMHLTLGFLGDVEAEDQAALHEALAEVRVGSFVMPVRGVGSFGGARPTVLWAGVGNGHPHLFALHKRVQDAILRARLKPDLRAFHPHVTLARPRGVSAAVLRPFLRAHAETEFGVWAVQEFVLFSSQLAPSGSVYTAEMRRALE